MLCLVSAAAFLLGIVTNVNAVSPIATASVQAPWNEAPLALQILETVSLLNNHAFFEVLDTVCTSDQRQLLFSPNTSPKDVYNIFFPDILSNHFSPEDISLIKLSLAIKEASPRIEAFYNVYLEQGLQDSESSIFWVDNDATGTDLLEHQFQMYPKHLINSTLSYQPLSFDHNRQTRNIQKQDIPTGILYSDVSSNDFCELHQQLSTFSNNGQVKYILRWKPSSLHTQKDLQLSGYGISLDVKKSDYLAIDDRPIDNLQDDIDKGTKSKTSRNSPSNNNKEFDSEGVSWSDDYSQSDLPGLTAAHVQDLGLKAARFVSRSSDPLSTLIKLTQNFPMHARSLVDIWEPQIHAPLVDEIRRNQATKLPAGYNIFWMNGIQIPPSDIEPFTLMNTIYKEKNLIDSLVSLGMNSSQAVSVLSHSSFGKAQNPGRSDFRRGVIPTDALGEVFDASDRAEGGDLVLWWNDITKDSRYQTWSTDLGDMLRRGMPGSLPSVRYNLFNIVLVLDLSKPLHTFTQAKLLGDYVLKGYPFRFGVVPFIPETSSSANSLNEILANLLWMLPQKIGRSQTLSFFREISAKKTGEINEKKLRQVYAKIMSISPGLPSFENITKYDPQKVEKARQYLHRLGIYEDEDYEDEPHVFIDGVHFRGLDGFHQGMQATFSMHMQYLQQQIYFQNLQEKTDNIENFFYDLPTARPIRNNLIYPSGSSKPRYVNLVEAFNTEPSYMDGFIYPNSLAEENDENEVEGRQSIWVLSNFKTNKGLQLATEAIKFLNATHKVRIKFIHNGIDDDDDFNEETIENKRLLNTLASSSTDLKAYLKSLSTVLGDQEVVDLYQLSTELGWKLADKINIPHGSSGIIIGGRVIGPFEPTRFVAGDFKALMEYEEQMRKEPIIKSLKQNVASLYESNMDNILAYATGIIGVGHVGSKGLDQEDGKTLIRNRDYRLLEGELSSFEIGTDIYSSWLQIGVSIDPLNEVTQKWSAILQTLSKLHGVHVTVYLNPSDWARELPIKRFFRYHYPSELVFNSDGQEVDQTPEFIGMPKDVLFTLSTHTPHSWLAFPAVSPYDLDNIRLSDVSEDVVKGVFELKNLIVEGHAIELPRDEPPRGLQLVLSNKKGDQYDSLVMANLGYFQLKAVPGTWEMTIRPGPSSDVYEFSDGSISHVVDVVDFAMKTPVLPKFHRRPGKENVELYDEKSLEDSELPSTWAEKALSMAQNVFKSSKDGTEHHTTAVQKRAEINVFTVASGLLYERMAFIMILSVLQHTNHTCKFWIIENFVSPSFKAFIPHLAATYGFEYELITYKWPPWLRAQKEKQRTIWGYKILFLDVLFPLELDRVIFVDSDQIVRTDLKELVDMDLEGAPYAYAPMGDDRVEMEGFRFWKHGYWSDHLAGKPYHISALYVVDLDRFRRSATGDNLRGQYQLLSSDPNSLANLDQDLPNSMQHAIPIHTLDKSWLWCETWCSDESLAEAKTIDLCNNPMTHEPKLERAKRLIPEWTEYDQEIAQLAEKVKNESKDQKQINAFGGTADRLGQAKEQEAEWHDSAASSSNVEEEGNDFGNEQEQEHSRDEL